MWSSTGDFLSGLIKKLTFFYLLLAPWAQSKDALPSALDIDLDGAFARKERTAALALFSKLRANAQLGASYAVHE